MTFSGQKQGGNADGKHEEQRNGDQRVNHDVRITQNIQMLNFVTIVHRSMVTGTHIIIITSAC